MLKPQKDAKINRIKHKRIPILMARMFYHIYYVVNPTHNNQSGMNQIGTLVLGGIAYAAFGTEGIYRRRQV